MRVSSFWLSNNYLITLVQGLAESLIWLHAPGARKFKDLPTSLMIGHFESWLNGLVYELYFSEELHARKLKLFDMAARLVPPDLEKLSDSARMSRLQELFEKTYDTSSTLRAMLYSLRSLEVVRIIEEAATPVITGNRDQ